MVFCERNPARSAFVGVVAAGISVGGGFGLSVSDLGGQAVGLYGYPAEGKYNGLDLTYCQGSAFTDPYNSSAWGVKCSMNGGASGGPWLKGDARTFAATAVGANSYRYTTGGLNNLYSAKFTSRTSDVFAAATAGSASGNVVRVTF